MATPISDNLKTLFADEAVQNIEITTDIIKSGNSASGSIVTFDGDGLPVTDLTAEITAVQNLNGYDHPWVGGSGKNKFQTTFTSQTVNGTQFTANADGSVTITGTPSSNISSLNLGIVTLSAGTYKASGCSFSGSGRTLTRLNVVNSTAGTELGRLYVGNDEIEFTLTEPTDITFRPIVLTSFSGTATYYPMIRLATETDATFTPYENICPISGYSSVNVVDCGKNLANFVDGYGINANGNPNAQAGRIATLEPIYIKEGQSYKFVALGTSNPRGLYAVWNGNTLVRRIANVYSGETLDTSNGTHFYVCAYTDITVESAQAMVILSTETDTSYEPYNGTTYPISLGSTIYGGTLDVTNGVLTVTHMCELYDGSSDEAWAQNGPLTNNSVYIDISNSYKRPQTVVSSVLKGIAPIGSASMSPFTCCVSPSSQTLLVKWDSELTPTTFKAFLAQTNMQVVYELATPTTIQLDPTTITTLLGENVIYADCGDVSVTYPTYLKITNEDIMFGTFTIDRTIMAGSSLNIGSCVASELNMTLDNWDGRFNEISWSGAELNVSVGAEGSDETCPMGVFYIDHTPKTRSTISISALDGMVKFDKLLSSTGYWRRETEDGSQSAKVFVNWCCTKCGVTLATNIDDYPNSRWSLWLGGFRTYLESDAGKYYTCRDLLGWAVAMMGKVAWMNADGELEIGFPPKVATGTSSATVGIAVAGLSVVGTTDNTSTILSDEFGKDKRYSSDYEDTAIRITGVIYNNSYTNYTYMIGSDEYPMALYSNEILTHVLSCDSTYNPEWGSKDVSALIDNLVGLIGFRYTPVSMTVVPCPQTFPADWVEYVIDENKSIFALVTNYTFSLNGNNYIASEGEMPQDKALASISSFADVQSDVNITLNALRGVGSIVTGAWTASTSTSALTVVTDSITIDKGKWIVIFTVPDATASNSYGLQVTSGSTDLASQNWLTCSGEQQGVRVITVYSETATMRLRTGNSTSTTYSNFVRGGLYAIKIAN